MWHWMHHGNSYHKNCDNASWDIYHKNCDNASWDSYHKNCDNASWDIYHKNCHKIITIYSGVVTKKIQSISVLKNLNAVQARLMRIYLEVIIYLSIIIIHNPTKKKIIRLIECWVMKVKKIKKNFCRSDQTWLCDYNHRCYELKSSNIAWITDTYFHTRTYVRKAWKERTPSYLNTQRTLRSRNIKFIRGWKSSRAIHHFDGWAARM